jgi:hyperosmotically inducible protein
MNELINSLSRPGAACVVLAVFGALALAGCNKADNRTVGERINAGIGKTEQAADTAAAKTKAMMVDAKVRAEIKDTSAAIFAKVDDAAITAAVSAGLARDPELSAIEINVTTAGGAVSLKGPARSAKAKARAGDIAKAVQGVLSVNNELEVRT